MNNNKNAQSRSILIVIVILLLCLFGAVVYMQSQPETQAVAELDPAEQPQAQETEESEVSSTVEKSEAEPPAEETVQVDEPQRPVIDTIRIDEDGAVVLAGTAQSQSTLQVLIDDQSVQETVIDATGSFALFFDIPSAKVVRVLSLVSLIDGVELFAEQDVIISPTVVKAPVEVAVLETDVENNTEDNTTALSEDAEEAKEQTNDTPASDEAGRNDLAAQEVVKNTSEDKAVTEADATTSDEAEMKTEVAEQETETPDDQNSDAQTSLTVAALPTSENEAEQTAPQPEIAATTEEQNADALEKKNTEEENAEVLKTEASKTEVLEPSDAETAVVETETSKTESVVVEETPSQSVETTEAETAVVETETSKTESVAVEETPSQSVETTEAETEAASTQEKLVENTDTENTAASESTSNDAAASLSETDGLDESEPLVLMVDQTGVSVLQSDDQNKTPEQVDIETISYDEEGEVALAGRGNPSGSVRIYLDNRPISTAAMDELGQWNTALSEIDAGIYTLRVDELDASGAVTSRLETPFKRERVEDLARYVAQADTPARINVVTVQPGNTLWALARERYGQGILYVRVFEANKDKIRNPDLIYPGQVFQLPNE